MNLKITLLSNYSSWLNDEIAGLRDTWDAAGHEVSWVHKPNEVPVGDLCFLIGCSNLLHPKVLERNQHNLVVHESDLPKGKGWSPLTWQIIEGAKTITVTLFEAVTAMDSGPIYLQEEITFEGHELLDELHAVQSGVTKRLCDRFVKAYPEIIHGARAQKGKGTIYHRRSPEDSRLDPQKSIADQFDLLRVVDNERYPAFFEMNGFRYVLQVRKDDSFE